MRACIAVSAVLLLAVGCSGSDDAGDATSEPSSARDAAPTSSPEIALEFEEYELPNGLDVILHVDRSDPVAAVLMTFHVGSAREVPNRTGFAHLFEHLFFLDSENLGPGGLDRLMTRIGSSTNGSTNEDRTNYFEVVPIDGLEKALWAESDKLGFFINTVTESVLEKEKEVVKNEKRQSYDNVPYGHLFDVIHRAIFPPEHPYSWQVIGSLADLDAATLEDVVDFHSRWYGPNNATLAIAGDIDVEQTKAWIEKYFGEIPERAMPPTRTPPPVVLEEEQRLVHEDPLAELPELTLAWPTVPEFADDAFPLSILASLLSEGKQTPLYEAIVEQAQLAPEVFTGNSTGELAGRFGIRVRAHAGVDLDDVLDAIEGAFERFARDGPSETELERIKARYEADFYAGLSSVFGKAVQLTDYSLFAPRTDYVNEHLRKLLGVTSDDVMRVFRRYLVEQPFVAASFVPLGEAELALEGSTAAEILVEPIVPGEGEFELSERSEIPLTPSKIDRATEPPFGRAPSLAAPEVGRLELDNGLGLYAIADFEAPLVSLSLRIEGGMLAENPETPGAANLLAEILTEGTAERTPEELELAIDSLGAALDVSAGSQYTTLRASVLARNFPALMDLVAEILFEPRWDEGRFALAKERVKSTLIERSADPVALADDTFRSLLYGDHPLARSPLGTPSSVDALDLDDLRDYYTRVFVSSGANLHVAGAVSFDTVESAARALAERWEPGTLELPEPPAWDAERAGLYFLDVPGAAQSVLTVGYLALAETDPDFYPAEVMNFRFGGGGFASDLTQVLREKHGYTYRIRSGFSGTRIPGPFMIQSRVRANVTRESLELIKELMERHGADFDAEDLDVTQSFLLKSNALAFETLDSKVRSLEEMSAFGFPADYVLEREEVVRAMTIERIQELAGRYLDPEDMIWLVVGDAASQRARLGDLGLGEAQTIER